MRSWKFLLPLLASSLCFAVQPDRIVASIDSSQLVPLKGNVHGLAQDRFDLGRADSSQMIHGVTLVFHPSAAQQADLDKLLVQQQDRTSPNYHKWLTPAQFADRFGMTQADIARVTTWLESQGFTVTSVANSRNQISFDGTVAQVESVFATEIHNYIVDAVIHFANSTSPSVPAALAGSVLAVGHLHNFSPKPRLKVRSHFTSATSGNHFLTPADFATIYDIGPLYTAGIDGTGQKIAIVGQSAVNPTDLSNFRSNASLSASTPQFILYPTTSTSTHCSGDEGESDLDLEWSGGVAKNASIIFVYAGLTGTDTCTGNRTYSVWDALQQSVDNNYAPIISTSYGFCESGLGQAFTNTVRGWAQQANSQGQTIMSASGDDGAADCDFQVRSATQGLAVDVPASLPEVTGMGGTEFFGDPASTSPTTYWNATGTSDDLSSALSYIPEEGWNDTAVNLQSPTGTIGASGGGASIYFTKNPGDASWQTGVGVPSDGKRDVPDLSVTTSPDHDGYLFCSPTDGAGNPSCTKGFRDSSTQGYLDVVGGTSAAAPTFAGIVALLNQYLGSLGLGNINPTLYKLAASNPSAFHDVTTGNNIVPCTVGTTGCPTTGTPQYGFTAGVGYDQVTGLGSVDVNNLAVAWASSRTASSVTILSSAAKISAGAGVTFTATVTPSTGVGSVSFSTLNNGTTTLLGTATLNTPYPPSTSGTAVFTTTLLPGGNNSVTATYQGDASDNVSTSSPAVVAVTDFSLTVTNNLAPASVPAGQSAVATLTIAPVNGSTETINFTPASCTGLSTGAACSFNPTSVTLDGVNSQNVQLTVATAANMALGAENITVTGTPSVAGGTPHTANVSLTVAATNQTLTIAPTNNTATFSVTAGGTVQIPISVTGTNGFIVASSSTTALPLNYTCTGFPSESTCTFSPQSGSSVSQTMLTMSIATTAPVAQLQTPFGHSSRIFYALLLPGMFGIVFAGRSPRRGARLLSLIVVLSLSTLWLGACGGSNSSQKNPGTPKGTYPVVVNATTGGANPLTSTMTVNLTVN
jgi:hypothetical protein